LKVDLLSDPLEYTFASRACGQHYDPSDDSGIEYDETTREPCKIEVEVEMMKDLKKHLFFKFLSLQTCVVSVNLIMAPVSDGTIIN
jgi:hypothetical protein